ncbi:Methenyltetrahydrofolate synthase domain-containing protein [Takifugu flavidus]|uniref:Methenyltetrahydrofolate synthase domain-containing protein n=1 Tax=Takifugu flavidus TaxID=433684 RepID=A0A5C6NLM6_9TELE|nr:Methenyltetrahydrofolate synthase domain-containing protein [Takifugu flavidus]
MACLKCAMAPVIIINPGTSKWDIREKVWAYIESKNLANYPRPVFNRIPNFKGAAQACNRLSELQEFRSSQTVKVNPDRPQQQARFATLEGAFTACSRVSELDVFARAAEVKVDPDKPLEGARLAVLQGVKLFSVPIELDAKLKVDLVVVGSVAVSEKGLRIGKGEGFADMEYGMMASMGALSDSTVVVTIVHDCQILDIPEELIESHDLTVDYILTPTRVIKTNCQRPKPQGIIWRKLSKEKLEKIPILRRLRAFEEKTLKDVSLGPTPIPAAPSLQTGSSMAGQKTTDRPEGESTEGARAQLGQKDRRQKRGWQRRGNRQKQGPEEGGQGQTEAGSRGGGQATDRNRVQRKVAEATDRSRFRGRQKQGSEEGGRGNRQKQGSEEGGQATDRNKGPEEGGRGHRQKQGSEEGGRGNRQKQGSEEGGQSNRQKQGPEKVAEATDRSRFRGRWPRPQTEAGSEEGGRGHRQKQGSEEGGRGNRQKQGPEEGGQSYRQKQGPEEGGQSYRQKQGPEEGGSEAVPLGATTVCLTALPSGLRVSELKRLLREQDAAPLKLTWLGAQQEAQLDYSNCQAAQRVLKVLQGLSLQAELSKGPQGEECSGWSH